MLNSLFYFIVGVLAGKGSNHSRGYKNKGSIRRLNPETIKRASKMNISGSLFLEYYSFTINLVSNCDCVIKVMLSLVTFIFCKDTITRNEMSFLERSTKYEG